MVSPLGLNVADSWAGALAGKSGVGPVESFDVTDYATRFGASVKNFNPELYFPNIKEARKFDTFIQYGIAAATEAIKDSGIQVSAENASRIGVALGSGIGGLPLIE